MLRASLLLALCALPAMASGAQTCAPGTAEARLRGVDVEAALFTNGNLFFGNQTTDGDGYVTPLGENAPDGRPLSPVFASNFWLGGKVGGEIRASAARYSNFAFRPGLTGADHIPPDSTACAEADRIWVVSRDDIAAYYAGAAPEADLLEWPVHVGAPVLDGDGIAGNYNLAAGDQPAIRGDVMAFWSMTDLAAELDYGPTVGVDVTAEAFVIRTAEFRDETFYRFAVTNRKEAPIDSAYVGSFVDFDIGEPDDDHIGTDTTAALLYAYNSADTDPAYPGATPAVGISVLAFTGASGAGLTAVADYPNTSTGFPRPIAEAYSRLQGLWADGTPVRASGSGYGQPQDVPATRVSFPGDPTTGKGWTEAGAGLQNLDRRGIIARGPFELAPDSTVVLVAAILHAQGADRFDSITRLRADARRAIAAQASGAFEPRRVEGFMPRVRPLAVGRPRPNPFRETTSLLIQAPAETVVRVSVYDTLGRRLSQTEATTPEARVEVGRGLAPGVYVVRVESSGFAETFTAVKTR